MADFRTHVIGAALASGVAATALELAIPSGHRVALCLFALGVTGGMLPDLDSDHSVPLRLAFNGLAILAGFASVFRFTQERSLLELVALGLAAFLVVRYGVLGIFSRLTVHRGLFHSIPAAAVAGLLAAILSHRELGWSPLRAWFAAVFVSGGFMVHLALDELCSVDLLGQRMKRSFGTALCLGSARNKLGTLALYAAIAALYALAPPAHEFVQRLRDPATFELLRERLLPPGMQRG